MDASPCEALGRALQKELLYHELVRSIGSAEDESVLERATESEGLRELTDEEIDRMVAEVVLDEEQEQLYLKLEALTPSR